MMYKKDEGIIEIQLSEHGIELLEKICEINQDSPEGVLAECVQVFFERWKVILDACEENMINKSKLN